MTIKITAVFDTNEADYENTVSGILDLGGEITDEADLNEQEVNRSAVTGQFVSDAEVAAHPDTTVTETI